MTVLGHFRAHAAAQPHSVAMVSGGAAWSYAALDEASRRIAAGLCAAGVGPGDRVGLMLPRGFDALAAILAILHRGAAYLPLDPAYPPAARDTILADARPAITIVAEGDTSVPAGRTVDALRAHPADRGEAQGGGAGDPAYVMYTSGSTGQPKGVIVPHRAIERLVIGADYAAFGRDEVMLHLAPLAFDASTFEIWGALAHGATLAVVAEPQPTLDAIATALRSHRVTTAWLTAGLFHLMADHRMDALGGLRQLLAGGDVLSPPHVARVLQACPGLRLINGYGPTENTTFTCCHTVTQADLDGRSIPIGRPIHGTTVSLRDPEGAEVAPGCEGQLCAGGLGVALGYLDRPALTQARFVPDPDMPGARLYLTGDRAVRQPDGTLRFLGRVDRQIKLNGHRIELEEIEHALRRLPGARDAVAVLAGQRLIGYVAAPTHQADAAEDVRLLHAMLPAWAVPGCIMRLETLPLTTNGKIDRAALPEPPRAESRAARGALEQRLAAIFARVLGVPSVGRDDNFFDLGASSLQLIEAQAEIARTVQPDCALLTLFAAPRISQLAERLGADTPRAAGTGAAARAGRAAEAMRRARKDRVA